MLGFLAGLAEDGIDVRRADKVIGTSAGSVVGAQILSGGSYPELLRRQTDPAAQAPEEPVSPKVLAAAEAATKVLEAIGDPRERLRRLGEFALTAPIADEASHRSRIVQGRLVASSWPAKRLLVTAVDVLTGETCVFDRSSGVELVDAVAASCAVPKIWPTVTIGGRQYMDGGVRSLTHAYLASDAERALVVSPYSRDAQPFSGPTLRDEAAALVAQGVRVAIVEADADAIRIAGRNTLDPEVRPAACRAGQRQGRREAARLASEYASG